MNIAIIILAAGESKRMGVPKQLLDIRGESMLKKLIHSALDTSCFPITVVLGAHKSAIVPGLKDMPINIADNPHWQTGMASSVKMGLVGTYLISNTIDAVIIITADMPDIDKKVIENLVLASKNNPEKEIIASHYGEVKGVPALFRRSMFESLLDLKGDEGARKLIRDNADKVLLVEIGTCGEDLDTKEDYFRYLNSKN